MTPDILLLALFTGHVVGDFVLQSDGLVTRKVKNSWWILAHGLIVAGLTWGLLGSLDAWFVMLPVAIAHLTIDTVKIKVQPALCPVVPKTSEANSPNRSFALFLGDQFFHLLSLVLIWLVIRQWFPAIPNNYWEHLWGLHYTKGLILVSGFAVCVWGLGFALQHQMEPLSQEVPKKNRQGLKMGGKTIGLLERSLVFTFVLAGKPEGVAFVVAAKSVFRIGDLTDQDDRLHAEYIMIGTLRSFTYALITTFLMKWILAHIA